MNFKKTLVCLGAIIILGLTASPAKVDFVNAEEISEERYVGATGETQGDAIPITSSSKWRTKKINAANGGYYYSIKIKNSSIVTLNVKNTLDDGETISFRNPMSDDAVFMENITGKSKKYTFYVEPGTYVIYCGRYNRDDSGKVSIKCQWKNADMPKDTVNNDTAEGAVDISNVKKAFPGMLALGDKGDFYKISFSNRELKGVKIKNQVANSTRINVYDGSGGTLEAIGQHIMKKGETYTCPVTTEQGPVYIEVTGTDNGKYLLSPIWNVTSNSVKVIGKNITIYEGETKKVITAVSPKNADEDSYYIESSNKNIVGVASNKSITGCKAGTAKITIHYGRDYNETGRVYKHKIVCNVKVSKMAIKKITPNNPTVNLDKGKTYTCKVTISPKGASKDIVYKSSDAKVATVSQKGVIKGITPGKAVITISSADNPKVKATVTVNVGYIIKSVSVSKKTLKLVPGKNATLKAGVSPSNTKYGVTWSSSNTSVATVNQNGVVTAVSNGKAVITVTSNENPNAKASCSVTVGKEKIDVENIEISGGNVVAQGETITLSAVLKPNGAEGTISWSIADTSIATISSSGNSVKVKGKKNGTTYLTASAGGVKKTVSITVQ